MSTNIYSRYGRVFVLEGPDTDQGESEDVKRGLMGGGLIGVG